MKDLLLGPKIHVGHARDQRIDVAVVIIVFQSCHGFGTIWIQTVAPAEPYTNQTHVLFFYLIIVLEFVLTLEFFDVSAVMVPETQFVGATTRDSVVSALVST